jgi:hypothetical protein
MSVFFFACTKKKANGKEESAKVPPGITCTLSIANHEALLTTLTASIFLWILYIL